MASELITAFTSSLPPTAVLIMDEFLDPAFPDEELDRIDHMKDKTRPGRYNWTFKEDIEKVSPHLHRFYKKAIATMGLDESQIVGIEFWANIFGPGDGIHMHSDLDEPLFRTTRRMECAIAGTMCFGRTKDLKGGSFVFESGVKVRPVTNRAVLFIGGTRHGVEPVIEGERRALLAAFWHRVPTAHEHLVKGK
jgi:hypothetical protein